jgi:hypothetical protein
LPVETGQMLLHYRLVEKIGEGGQEKTRNGLMAALDGFAEFRESR